MNLRSGVQLRFDTAVVWQDRNDMVRQALHVSIPWFTFVNVSFALIIVFRNALISGFDHSISNQKEILPFINGIAIGIIALSLLLTFFIYRLPARLTSVSMGLVLILSLMWSYCSYHFIVWWHLPFAWPLSAI